MRLGELRVSLDVLSPFSVFLLASLRRDTPLAWPSRAQSLVCALRAEPLHLHPQALTPSPNPRRCQYAPCRTPGKKPPWTLAGNPHEDQNSPGPKHAEVTPCKRLSRRFSGFYHRLRKSVQRCVRDAAGSPPHDRSDSDSDSDGFICNSHHANARPTGC
ncbi:hypothetical protein BJY00DRAFT_152189 [Aspergillus carlsbadensis]|nr:hypothetical protein BJY00DRAFT_152189 [Aspergillus carlsbadensis]